MTTELKLYLLWVFGVLIIGAISAAQVVGG